MLIILTLAAVVIFSVLNVGSMINGLVCLQDTLTCCQEPVSSLNVSFPLYSTYNYT